MENTSRTSETRNGSRQPHSANSIGVMKPPNWQTPTTTSARRRPSVAVVWIHAVS